MSVDPRRHRGHGDRCKNGFSLMEMAVVLVIVSILLWVIGTRFFQIQMYAEQAATEQVLGALQRTLGTKVAEYYVKGETKRIETLEASNPMDFLAQVPKTYLGALRQPKPGTVQGGHWYFDAGKRILVYHVRNADQVEGGARNPARLRWSVRLQYEDRNGNNIFDSGLEQVVSVQLVPLEPFRWKR